MVQTMFHAVAAAGGPFVVIDLTFDQLPQRARQACRWRSSTTVVGSPNSRSTARTYQAIQVAPGSP